MLHVWNSKKCAEKERSRPKPVAHRHNLDDPEFHGSDGDEPLGINEGADDHPPPQLSPILGNMFSQYTAAAEALPDHNEQSAPSHEPASVPILNSLLKETPWVQDFPRPTGQTYGQGVTRFEEIQELESANGWGEWGPFTSKKEWDFAKFLVKNVNQTKINELLKLETVSYPI